MWWQIAGAKTKTSYKVSLLWDASERLKMTYSLGKETKRRKNGNRRKK